MIIIIGSKSMIKFKISKIMKMTHVLNVLDSSFFLQPLRGKLVCSLQSADGRRAQLKEEGV